MANKQLVYAPKNSQLFVLPAPVQFARDPTTTDTQYTPGQLWYNTSSTTIFIYQTGGVWQTLATSSGTALSILGTANQITATTVGTVATLTIPAAFTAPGSITATTTLTATAGAITATNGNLVLGTAGNKIRSTSVGTTTAAGANSFGSVALVGGTATVATTAVTASSLIFLTCQALGTVAVASGYAVTAKVASTSFTITASAGTDTSTIAWFIVN